MNIKVGDIVTVIGGGSEADKFVVDKKGVKTRKTGKVLKVYAKTNRVIVEGINFLKKHQRPEKENEPGKIVEAEGPIDASNVAIVDPKEGVPTRIGIKVVNGKRVRYAKKSGTILDDVKVPKKASKGASV